MKIIVKPTDTASVIKLKEFESLFDAIPFCKVLEQSKTPFVLEAINDKK